MTDGRSDAHGSAPTLRVIDSQSEKSGNSVSAPSTIKIGFADRHNRALRVLGVAQSGQTADDMVAAFDGIGDVELNVTLAGPSAISQRDGQDLFDLLLVEIDPTDQSDLEHLRHAVHGYGGDAPILATCKDASMPVCRQLMRIGVADIIPQPIARGDLVASLPAIIDKVHVKKGTGGERQGKVLSFLRANGGAGTTTIALESAAYLRKRFSGQGGTVCVLDLDLQFGDVAVAMDLSPSTSIYQILETPARLDGELLRSCMSRHESGIWVLAASPDVIPMTALDSETAKKLIRVARQQFDFVIVDLPYSWMDWTAHVLAASDLVSLVMPMTVSGVHHTLRTLRVMQEQRLTGLPIAIVGNRVADTWRVTGRIKEIERALGRSIAATIRGDWKSASAARDRGVFVADAAPKSKVVADIAKFMESAVEQYQLAPAGKLAASARQ